jgi:hypothetical protein
MVIEGPLQWNDVTPVFLVIGRNTADLKGDFKGKSPS